MADNIHLVCPHCASVNRVPTSRPAALAKCGRCAKRLFLGAVTAVDTNNFRRHLERSDIPILVDFWAAWCGPCRMMSPEFSKAAELLEPQVRLLKVNTEEEQSLAAELGIRSIPTMMLFKRGRQIDRMSGAMDAAGIVDWTRARL